MIQKYIQYLSSIRNYSSNTCSSYQKDLSAFSRWAKAHIDHAQWSKITRADIDRYITDMATAGLKPATTNRALAAISGIYTYMQREGYPVENPCKYESRRKISRSLPNTIDEEQLRKAYDNAQGVKRLLLGVLSTTGIRIQELLNLTWEDINFNENSLRINGKGAKERLVYTTNEVLEELANVHRILKPHGRIFGLNQRDARHMIWEALSPYCQAKQLSPHAIRHTFATNLAKHGVNVSQIGTLLGHEHIETTQKYIDMTQHNNREIVQQYSLFN